MRQRPSLLKRFWNDSQTKLLAYGQAASGAVLYAANKAHDAVTSAPVSEALDKITLPMWFPWILLALAGLTYVAHGHGDDA